MLKQFTNTSIRRGFSFLLVALAIIPWMSATAGGAGKTGPLKVSENKRFLVHEDGTPVFYLGDTAWELFHRLNREEADRYLANRATKGFTVIQAVAWAELDGLHTPNSYGHKPLIDDDPTKPDIKDGPDNDYWDHVDYIVKKAESLGIYIGMLPTWGDKWNKKWGVGPEVFTAQNAETYGRWLGQRYKDAPNIIWILGGDRPIENDTHKEIIRAMARGLAQGDGDRHLMTFHPTGGQTSAAWFHDDDWLDFNMRQNGHVAEYTGRYDGTRADYDRTPAKPVIDGEPIYEDHPVSFDAKKLGHSISSDVRRPLYWDLFGGACGHTYGHHSVWQMWQPGRDPINNPLMPWFEAIDQPGAEQMQYGRWLMESRPFLSRVPDDSILVTDRVPTSVPGAGRYRFVGTRDADGSYAMVYAPIGRAFKVRMDVINGATVKAWWYNPRNGQAVAIGEFPNVGERQFVPPDKGEMLDWVLVLDDASRDFPPPGARGKTTLGVEGTRFTLNGKPAFLLGISYYGGLGASQDSILRDLDDAQHYGFNWLRVWATWGLGDRDVSAVDPQGLAREPFLDRLRWLVGECDRRGLVVDVTLTRNAAGRLPDFAAHQRAVATLVEALKTHRNWYLDLANERDVRDDRYVSISEIKTLRDQVRRLDPQRLVTASFGGHDLGEDDVRESLVTADLDFLCPHRPRHGESPRETAQRTRDLLGLMEKIGRTAPVHYQEPFRRGYTEWEPTTADFLADLRGAVAGGAAGWCFHNGTQRNAPDQEPRRSFDLSTSRLFDQLDREELAFVAEAARIRNE
ncbi:MAG: glycoside hydrolase family 140 protein [Phycisphaerales bacterium]